MMMMVMVMVMVMVNSPVEYRTVKDFRIFS